MGTSTPLVVPMYRHPGEAVQNLEMFLRAWDECEELQVQSREDWVGRALLALQELPRWEIGAFADGKVVGGIVLAEDQWDAHVGNCCSVFTQYVLPEYRHTGVSRRMMRMAVSLASAMDAKVLAFTHRKGPWRYETIYRRIK